jgi:hypothetical protein
LLIHEATLRRQPAPLRTATIVAAGHVILLAISTAEARSCFKGEYLDRVRTLAFTRQQVLMTSNGAASGSELASGDSAGRAKA